MRIMLLWYNIALVVCVVVFQVVYRVSCCGHYLIFSALMQQNVMSSNFRIGTHI